MNLSSSIGSASLFTNKVPLSTESNDLLQRLRINCNSYFFRLDNRLSQQLHQTSPLDLSNMCKHLFDDMILNNAFQDPIKCLHRLAAILPFLETQASLKAE